MFNRMIKKISTELERLTKFNISVERALDLMEASTHDLKEIIAINTMRESLSEIKSIQQPGDLPFSINIPNQQSEPITLHA